MRKAPSKMQKDGESMNPSKDDLRLNKPGILSFYYVFSGKIGCFLTQEYQLKPGDGQSLNYIFTKHKEALENLDVL